MQTVRADFCGPDGSPIVSILVDSSGTVLFHPGRDEAFFVPGGIPLGNGLITVNALISMLRTGFPAEPVAWEMTDTAEPDEHQHPRWIFIASELDSLVTVLAGSALFPITCTDETSVSVTAFSWHDEFQIWPMEWEYSSPALSAVLKIRSIEEVEEHPAGGFDLVLPVPVDTLESLLPFWNFAVPVEIR